jgi:hypothetical protein
VALLAPVSARAQIYEAVGTRAQGMGGAFVAVADDATATWWNPAGLATGAFLSLILERGRADDPSETIVGPGERDTATSFAVAFPALGLSYYRLRISEIAPIDATTGSAGQVREDGGTDVVRLRSFHLNQFGSTVGQSIGQHFVIATTVKIVSAGRSTDTNTGVRDLFDQASDLDVDGDTETDMDVGAMAALGSLRLGLSVRHLWEPGFGEGSERFELKRQARAGVAWRVSSPGLIESVTAAFDADLTRTGTALGDVRYMAGGIEVWSRRKQFAVRGGVSGSTVGETRWTSSVGGSVSSGGGTHVNGAWILGSDDTRAGWQLGLSMTF